MKKRLDKILSSSVWKQLLYLIILVVFVGILFIILARLFSIPLTSKDNSGNIWYVASRLFDFGFLEKSENKLFEFTIAIVGWVLCTGLLIAIITNAYFSRIDKVVEGQTRYYFKDHCIILGNNEMTRSLINQIANWNKFNLKSKIIIHTEQNVKEVKNTLKSHLPNFIEKRIFVFRGARDSQEELETLHIDKAKIVVVLGEKEESGIDSRNVECVKLISEILTKKRKSNKELLDCYLYLENQTTFTLLQQYELPTDLKNNLNLLAFNLHENWANRILTGGKYMEGEKYEPLDHEPITIKNGKQIRFVILGFNRMGQALAIQAARIAHFGNNKKTIITIIDYDLDESKNTFHTQFPGLNQLSDVEFEFLETNIQNVEVRKKMKNWAFDEKIVLTIAVCFRNPDKSLTIGLNLPSEVFDNKVSIFIRQEVLHGIASTISAKKLENEIRYNEILTSDKRLQHLKFFGMLSDACDLEFERDILAKKFHLQYLKKTKEDGRFNTNESNFKDWEKLPEQYKWSNRYMVDIFSVKLRALANNSKVFSLKDTIEDYRKNINLVYDIAWKNSEIKDNTLSINKSTMNLYLEDIELLAEIEHNRWMAERVFGGWNYGKIKDNIKRLTPYLVPYKQLSEEIQTYDRDISVRMFDFHEIIKGQE